MKIYKKSLVLLSLTTMLMACNSGQQHRDTRSRTDKKKNIKDALIDQNRQLIFEELELIDAFSERYHLDFDTTSTGLRYIITEATQGVPARLMNDITISYSASLLNGDLCYSSDSTGLLNFTLGQSDQPSGLQEGILKMKEGEKAIFIVPSYLAYGISGDGICIPGSTSIFYKVKLEKVKK